jgi:hypothetical protein
MRIRFSAYLFFLLLGLMLAGCSKKESAAPNTAENNNNPAQTSAAPTSAPDAAPTQAPSAAPVKAAKPSEKPSSSGEMSEKRLAVPKTIIIPAGTVLTVRLSQALGSKISQTGQSFSATLAQPIEMNGTVAVPAGAEATGTVAEAVPQGRFKGGAVLRLTLNSLTVKGAPRQIQTTAVSEATKGKGKRTAVLAGGGAGLGAIIGGIAGGGKGAALGALAGGGAGGAGAAFTGRKDVALPAESALSFKLTEPIEVSNE